MWYESTQGCNMRGGLTANRNASSPYGSATSWNEELRWLNIGSSSDSDKAMNADPEEHSSSQHLELDATSEF